MSSDKHVFLFAGTYPSLDDAHRDDEVLKALHAEGVVGTYEAAVVTEDDPGKVHAHEKPTQHGVWTGPQWAPSPGSCSRRRSSGRRPCSA